MRDFFESDMIIKEELCIRVYFSRNIYDYLRLNYDINAIRFIM